MRFRETALQRKLIRPLLTLTTIFSVHITGGNRRKLTLGGKPLRVLREIELYRGKDVWDFFPFGTFIIAQFGDLSIGFLKIIFIF